MAIMTECKADFKKEAMCFYLIFYYIGARPKCATEDTVEKLFKDVKTGERFQIDGRIDAFTGKPYVFEKILFMQNFYRTTGNKRNAKFVVSTSKMNNRYAYFEENQKVEVV